MCLSLCLYCDKTADWIWMPFGVVSGIGRGIGVLDGSGDRRREGAVLVVNVGHPIVTNEILCVRGGDAALPRLLWDFLFSRLWHIVVVRIWHVIVHVLFMFCVVHSCFFVPATLSTPAISVAPYCLSDGRTCVWSLIV